MNEPDTDLLLAQCREENERLKEIIVEGEKTRNWMRDEHAKRVQNLLEENSRLVDLRRQAEARDENARGVIAHMTAERLGLLVEINRLRAGDFTPEEIQHFCHTLPETVSREEFEAGCRAYCNKLYGEKPEPASLGGLT